MKMIIILPENHEQTSGEGDVRRLTQVIQSATDGHETITLRTCEEMISMDLRKKRIIFAVSLGKSGTNFEYYRMLDAMRNNENMFSGAVGGIVVDGKSDLYTKSVSRELALSANLAGCTFPGRSLVEATGTLYNFNIIAKINRTDNLEAYGQSVQELFERVKNYRKTVVDRPNLLVIYSGNMKTSNTYRVWEMVKKNLDNIDVKEISLQNGEIRDCVGCSYEKCLHFGKAQSCIYGGVITEEAYPAIIKCNGILLLCPNYNDAIGGHITAFINRLTSIFRAYSFEKKKMFSIVVSGYSGSDVVAKQVLGSLNMNKNFVAPGRFVLMETANNPNEVSSVDGIEDRTRGFGNLIKMEFFEE